MSRGHGGIRVHQCIVVVVVVVNDGGSVVVRVRSSVGRRLDEVIVECVEVGDKVGVNRKWQNDRGGSRRLVFMVHVDVAVVIDWCRKISCYRNFYCQLSTVQRFCRNKGLVNPG